MVTTAFQHSSPAPSSGAGNENLWLEVDEKVIGLSRAAADARAYRTLKLNSIGLQTTLVETPLEFSQAEATRPVEMDLPLGDGSYQTFRVVESSIMEPELAARFPEIKTYRGQSVDDPTITTRFDWTPTGFHAIILGPKETVLIEPYAQGNTEYYVVYFQSDVPVGSYACEVTTAEQDAAIALAHTHSKRTSPAVTSGTNLRTYRLAVGATAEYTQTYGGGTVSGGLAAITTTMNFVNAIYEREVAVRMVLVANETSVIFTDTATDGYTHDSVNALISENQTRLDSLIGSANYDIGHVFDGRNLVGAFSFQGRASISSVCQTGLKARGVSITRSIQPSDIVAYYIVAHEMGHQFSATHSFNASTGDCGAQRTAATAYEPGTGSTIMGYRFNCGTQDLMSQDTYFHNASIQQIVDYTTVGNGSSCPALTATGNTPPNVTTAAGYIIPHNTPFTLTASASDPDGDSLSYAWEQFDLGNPSPPNEDDGSRPLFRSLRSLFSATRDFPNIGILLNGGTPFFETLPTTNRTMNFRVTVRDNRSGGGGVNSAATQLQVTTSSGPFTITQPVAGAHWPTFSQQTVTWNVANTTSAPVNCANVSIYLSVDSGNSFPIVLALETPNDGSETVTIPGAVGFAAIKVVGRGNIFFNTSRHFETTGQNILTPTITGFSPGSGDAGTAVTITGTNFISPSSVTFNGVPAVFEVRSTTEIVAIVPNGVSTGPIAVSASGFTATSATNFVTGAAVQFSAAGYALNESGGAFNVMVNRSGSTAGVTTVNYRTSDTAGLENCNVLNGNASARCDYTTAVGTLRFEVGQTSKNISIPMVDDSYAEATETFLIVLSGVTGGSLGATGAAQLTINDNEVSNGPNPIDGTAFFVRQQYLDFLNREPDPAGYAAWQAVINGCAPNDTACDRIHVSSSFFRSPEFQDRGYFVYRFYPVAFGRKPDYDEFVPDLAKVSGFLSASELEAAKVAFITEFMARPAFANTYNSLNNTQYVDTLLATAGVAPHQFRDFWIAALGNGTRTRATVLRDIVESQEVYNKYFNQAFVVMQYFGYLRRQPDGQYLAWIAVLDSSSDYRGMINGFMNSLEYRFRFGP